MIDLIIIIGLIVIGIGICGTWMEIDNDENIPMMWIYCILGVCILMIAGMCYSWDNQDKQEEIDKYCKKAVEKGQFTSLEECKYVLEEY